MSGVRPFGPEIWIADGPVVSFLGFPYSTRMAVIRLGDGSLFVWSPVALSQPLRESLRVLGPVGHLVSPNALHHAFLKEWTSAYPTARLYASPRLRRNAKLSRSMPSSVIRLSPVGAAISSRSCCAATST